MSKQTAYIFPEEAEDLDTMSSLVDPTGTSHTLTVTVKADKTVTISSGSLEIRNGDKVIWSFAELPAEFESWTPVIKFPMALAGTRFRNCFTVMEGEGDQVEGQILGEKGNIDDSKEPYCVFLEKPGAEESPIKLKYQRAGSQRRNTGIPEPHLVIDQIGEPIPDHDHPCDPRRSRRF